MFSEQALKDSILFENDSLLVLNKPFGVVVNNSMTAKSYTVQDFILDYLGIPVVSADITGISTEVAQDFISRAGLVHRLDKDTSGVLLIAKTVFSFAELQRLFKSRLMKKEYVALVDGEVKPYSIKIEAPIKRNPNNRFKFAVVESGKPAQTLVKVIGKSSYKDRAVSLVKAYPRTGRTHQIRVHLAALGHSIIGDRVYSSKSNLSYFNDICPRLMLHASLIAWDEPTSGNKMEFKAPLPEDFSKWLGSNITQ